MSATSAPARGDLLAAADVPVRRRRRRLPFSPWHSFRKITLPLLSPASLFLAVWLTINALQLFDEVYLSTQGGPLNATTVLVYYLYDQAFVDFNFGYASAIAYFLFLIILVVTAIQFRAGRRFTHYRS